MMVMCESHRATQSVVLREGLGPSPYSNAIKFGRCVFCSSPIHQPMLALLTGSLYIVCVCVYVCVCGRLVLSWVIFA
jgi:hypothetical protein